MKKLFFLYAVVLLSFFVLSPARYGEPRGIEQYMVTVQQDPAAFVHDEFALCLVSNANNIITFILAHTDPFSRKIIHFLIIASLLFLLFVLARGAVSELWAALVFVLLIVFYDFNYAGFNSLFFSHDFDGKLLAGPFIVFAVKCFLEERPWRAGLALGAAFYLHAGIGVWFLAAMGSGIAVKIFAEKPWRSGQARKDFMRSLRFFAGFPVVFLMVVSPRVYELFVQGSSAGSFIPDSIQLDLFKYAWAGQTSIFLALIHSSAKWVLWSIVLANVFFLIIVLTHFKVQQLSRPLRTVYYIYVGTFIFVILNEILINSFQSGSPVYFGLVRVSGFNFLLLSILLSAVVVDVYRKGRYGEFLFWLLFLMNYSVVHFKHYSAFVQLILLGCIVLLQRAKGAAGLDASLAEAWMWLSARRLPDKLLTMFLILVVLLTGTRYWYKHTVTGTSATADYAEALEFVNGVNKEHSVVLYPFNRHEEFFALSQNPGFFNAYYIVLFNRLYKYDPQLQKRAYEKFVQLEQEFGINTVGTIKEDPSGYEKPWAEAWASKVDRAFIERWGEKYPIGYIVREKELASLPYELIHENSGFRVYRRE